MLDIQQCRQDWKDKGKDFCDLSEAYTFVPGYGDFDSDVPASRPATLTLRHLVEEGCIPTNPGEITGFVD